MQKKAKEIQITCDWCGKVKVLKYWDVHGKVYQACSLECRSNLQKVYMKKRWDNLTPEQRLDWVNKMKNSHVSDGWGFIEYYKKQRPERVKKVIELMSAPVEKKVPNQRFATRRDRRIRRGADKEMVVKNNPRIDSEMPRGTCTLIAAHHEMLKHDPERLTTAFMENMCGVDCKCKVKKEEQT